MSKSAKKEFNRESLLNQGVVTLFMGQGYHGTGLQEILDAVNVPKGSFIIILVARVDFGADVIQYYIDPFIAQLATYLDNSGTDTLGAIKCYFDEPIIELEKNAFKGGCLLGNLMGEIGDTSEVCQKSLQSAVNRYKDLLQLGIAKAQQQGTVRQDKSAEEMVDLLINTWQGALLRMKIEKSTAPVKQCCQNLLDDYFRP